MSKYIKKVQLENDEELNIFGSLNAFAPSKGEYMSDEEQQGGSQYGDYLIFVNHETGVDTNNGRTNSTPVKTMSRAIEIAQADGRLDIHFILLNPSENPHIYEIKDFQSFASTNIHFHTRNNNITLRWYNTRSNFRFYSGHYNFGTTHKATGSTEYDRRLTVEFVNLYKEGRTPNTTYFDNASILFNGCTIRELFCDENYNIVDVPYESYPNLYRFVLSDCEVFFDQCYICNGLRLNRGKYTLLDSYVGLEKPCDYIMDCNLSDVAIRTSGAKHWTDSAVNKSDAICVFHANSHKVVGGIRVYGGTFNVWGSSGGYSAYVWVNVNNTGLTEPVVALHYCTGYISSACYQLFNHETIYDDVRANWYTNVTNESNKYNCACYACLLNNNYNVKLP